jgi:hypothetical protein
MTKQKLTFKIDGGLKRLSAFYAGAADDAATTYWQRPSALLEALAIAPAKEIRLSSGYKKLADALDSLDYGLYHETLSAREDKSACGTNAGVFTSLWHAVSGYGEGVQAGGLTDEFNEGPIVAVAVSMITVSVAFVNLSGSNYKEDKEREERPGYRVPAGPRFASTEQLRDMAHHAQIVADQISWFS